MNQGGEIELLASCRTPLHVVKITQVDGHHLLCLNQPEALMMTRLFQVALLHEPTRTALQDCPEFARFHQQAMAGLVRSLASGSQAMAEAAQVRSDDSTSAGGLG